MFFKKYIASVFLSKTINHFLITSSGTVVNGFLGLLFYILIARGLGPGSYGIIAIAISTITLISDMADLGIDTGIIRFVGKQKNSEDALRYIKLGLEIKVVVWLTILLLGWFLSPLITQSVFAKPELSAPFRYALIGVGGALLFSLTAHALQAYQKFRAWSLVNISMNSLRLLAVIVLLSAGLLNFHVAMITYIVFPFFGFFVTLLLLPNFLSVDQEKSVSKGLFHYSKWIALTGVLTAAGSRLDTFISARLLTTAEVGIYSAALQLTVMVPQLVFALATVVAPKLSSLDNPEKARQYLKKLQFLVSGLCLGGILFIPFAIFFIPLIFGQAYQASITPFIILLVSQLIFLLALPAHQAVFYYFAKPKLFIWTAVGQLLITGIVGWVLISNFGTIGAALTVCVSNLFNFIIPGVWVVYQFKKGVKSEKEKYLGAYTG